MAHIDVFKGWAGSFRADIEGWKALLESEGADDHSRKLAGGALLYLVSRMDLIPDWNEGIGVIDDVMILRVCAQLLEGHPRGTLAKGADIALDRMANEAESITAFLGAQLYDKLKAYCSRLGDQAVRGRTPSVLLTDEAVREAVYVDLDDELKKTVPIVVNDPVDAELRLKAYLTHKLQ